VGEIHQIYCTHCTHGSSALERREGELAARMLGYSARAGSLEPAALRRAYRELERYIYYYLPRDTPADEKLTLTAATAPRRLVFVPVGGGLQVLGQISYRPTDTEGRVGSYFAHVLFADPREGGLRCSAREALQLWHARGWVEEDGPQIPHGLPTLSAAGDLLDGRPPSINDRLVLEFLTVPAGAALADPAQVVPPRWRNCPPDDRRRLLVDVLDAVLEALTLGRPLLAIVEPELAALLFYAVVRLLPPGLSEAISFSTYEPNPERLCTVLAASVFAQRAGDLRPEAYRGPGVVLHTFLNRRSPRTAPAGQYAAAIVERLAGGGWDAVDAWLGRLRAADPRGPADLELLTTWERLVPRILAGSAPPPEAAALGSPMVRAYLTQALGDEVLARAADGTPWAGLAGSPWQVPVLELLAAASSAGVRPAVELLLERLSGAQLPAVLAGNAIDPSDQLAVLTRVLTADKAFPAGCDGLWLGLEAPPSPAAEPLLRAALRRLDNGLLLSLWYHVPPERAELLLLALIDLARSDPQRLDILSHVVSKVREDVLHRALSRRGARSFVDYPAGETMLGQRLRRVLDRWARNATDFAAWIDLLLAGQKLLPDDRDRVRLATWDECRRLMREIERSCGLRRFSPGDWLLLEESCRQLAQGITRVVQGDGDPQDWAACRQGQLETLCAAVLDRTKLLPDKPRLMAGLAQKMQGYFYHEHWSQVPLEQMVRGAGRARPWSPRSGPGHRWRMIGVVSGVAALGALGIWLGSVAYQRHHLQALAEYETPVKVARPNAPQQTAVPGSVAAEPKPAPPAVGPPPAGPRTPMGISAGRKDSPPATNPDPPASAPPPTGGDSGAPSAAAAGAVAGKFSVQTIAGRLVNREYRAQLEVQLRAPWGQVLSPAAPGDSRLLARCRVTQVDRDGTVRPRVSEGERTFDPIGVWPNCREVSLDVQFLRRAPLGSGTPTPVAQTERFTLPELREGQFYQVTFTFSLEAWERLQAQAAAPPTN